MTDRELLELAAKAAGEYYGEWSDRSNSFRTRYAGYWKEWNPLTDDGDALRLAVKLKLTPHLYSGTHTYISTDEVNDPEGYDCSEFWGDDPYAATRRAIVRAAAEIGKAMK